LFELSIEKRNYLARSASLRAGLRRKERSFFSSYPALIPQRAQRASGTHWANFATRLTALGFGGIAFVVTLAASLKHVLLFARDSASNPTLAAKLKTRSQLRSKNGAPTFMVEERKSRCKRFGWGRLTSAVKAG